ncbi:similar to Saccharomyces cerevisiae YLR054C OSW2 Protein of unknown function proposed to be involved in the assembly of the spore wall [Maudiozyma saulgeensis]|uniref:Ketopantoate reductase C-terminal domain-containing protein n=1 Tax=Maudiozyma saulgeensis TaxID=1789683 RepID=A0A1X7R3M3_9SACH|nr:similar to Saccharomyces cerevisiae YLR054C OSW2 Protein of unknown function proposed to be involved in the assembly of the spore wall [Kazachstania saulgeensis]
MTREVTSPLTALIVGQTPTSQFLGWRLSLGNAFIILASKYVSSDSLVSWKSYKFGANFYAPNIFVKEVPELREKLVQEDDNNTNIYKIDVVVLAPISLDDLKTDCQILSEFTDMDTIVMISSDFGCELEPLVMDYLNGNFKCVMSIVCDVECRQLSLGSYVLVNDDHCIIHLGVTYQSENFEDKNKLSQNKFMVKKELLQINSITNKFCEILTLSKWLQVNKILSSTQMALMLWEIIIQKISLNILSIIYEQFDYVKLLETKSTMKIYKDLVLELMNICCMQCGSHIETFLLPGEKLSIDFNKIVELSVKRSNELANVTVSEHPEYLSLTFEAYCFYHRFQFPAHILLYQPILLAKKYKMVSSNLNFLFGFYTRLLSLSGLTIDGKHCQRVSSMFEKTILMDIEEDQKDSQNIKIDRSIEEPNETFPTISAELEKLYIDVDGYTSTNELPEIGKQITSNFPKNIDSSVSIEVSELRSTPPKHSNGVNDNNNNNTNVVTSIKSLPSETVLNGMCGSSSQSPDHNSYIKESLWTTDFETHGVVGIPHQYSTSTTTNSNGFQLNESIRSLEVQLRTSKHLFAKDYDRINGQLLNESKTVTKKEHDLMRQKYAPQETQIWRLQRRLNLHRGLVGGFPTKPCEDLLNHIKILNRGNTGDVLPFTTARFGVVDTFHLLNKNKESIMALFDAQHSTELANSEEEPTNTLRITDNKNHNSH